MVWIQGSSSNAASQTLTTCPIKGTNKSTQLRPVGQAGAEFPTYPGKNWPLRHGSWWGKERSVGILQFSGIQKTISLPQSSVFENRGIWKSTPTDSFLPWSPSLNLISMPWPYPARAMFFPHHWTGWVCPKWANTPSPQPSTCKFASRASLGFPFGVQWGLLSVNLTYLWQIRFCKKGKSVNGPLSIAMLV